MITLSIIVWMLLTVSAAAVVLWAVLLVRMMLILADHPTVRDGIDLPAPEEGWPALSIIVPAHNEQEMIDGCARLLRDQEYENLQIVFVLDRCTDDTAAVLAPHASADPRIVVIENDSCPDDWAGKCNAARLGAEQATGDWLLFTDADTRFDPQLVRAAVAIARDRDLALLSLLSTLTFEHRFERIAQVPAAMTLLKLYPIQRTDRARSPRPFANGQFMLFRRDWYDRIGGHVAVKDALLEDIAAAKLIAGHGGRTSVLFADAMLMCSMYDSLPAFEAGWRRVFIEACARKPGRLRKWSRRTLASGAVMPVLQVATLAAAAGLAHAGDAPLAIAMVATVLAGWGVQAAVLVWIYTLAHAPLRTILLFPLGCLIVGRIMANAARDLELGRPIVWGNKQYVLEPR